MNPKNRLWTISGAVLLGFVMLGGILPTVVGTDTTAKRWLLRGGLWLLGLVAAGLVYLWLAAKAKSTPQPVMSDDELDLNIAAARQRLLEAKGKAASFGRLPLLLVLGPNGGTKTTTVTRSGLAAELLAGEVSRGEAMVPTSAVNVWYAQGSVLVEAGGRLLGDAARWRKLIRYIQPLRLAAVMSKGQQAPRAALVCFPCDEFLKPGAAESVASVSQKLRERLAEAAQQIGIRLPVYVLFTKSDRLPFFEDFVRSFTREEAHDVLGATLPLQPAGNVGGYAERESKRIAGAFTSMFRSLAMRRLDVLPRETREAKAGAYEFPREFRKITELATQFLLDTCRPSQLGVSPFLRGFYFTGVRPVVVHDLAVPAEMLHARVPAGGTAVDATTVFDPRALYQQAAPVPQAQPGTRRAPEWVFLERVFRDVILRDGVARAITAGGTRVTLGRRIVLGTLAAALAFFSLGMTWSVFANRSLLGDVREAVADSRSLARAGAMPDLDALQRLDALRQQAARLGSYARAGNPLGTSWLLYAGNGVQPDVRHLYFRKFDELLWQPTRDQLLRWLAAQPTTPNESSNYDSTYDALKAHLVTSERPDSARRAFLAPVLLRFWLMNGQVDEERSRLAHEQFAFFADELPHGNPFGQPADAALVNRTRTFLRAFSGEDQLYSYLLAIARDSVPPVRWPDQNVLNPTVVPAEFTRDGWRRAQATLRNVPRLLTRETWVAGESTVAEGDRLRIEQVMRQRYVQDYATAWTRFLEAGRVPAVSNVRDAAAKLKVLSTNPSPLIRMIGLASDHTAVDTTVVRKAFAPAHALSTPNSTAPTAAAGKYVQTLAGYQAAVEQVASSTGGMREQVQLQASDFARQVNGVVNELALGFNAPGQVQLVWAAVRALLLAPITGTEGALGRVSVDELNRGGPALCAPLRSLGRRFPFNRAGSDAAPGDVSNQLAPNSGEVWTFHEANLQSLMPRSGSRFIITTGANPRPTETFRVYLNDLAQISNGLFNQEGNAYQMVFTLRMETSPQVPEINVTMGGVSQRFTRTSQAGRSFEWDATPQEARIVARVDNREVSIVTIPASPWWVFRLVNAAQIGARSADSYQLTWRTSSGVSVSGTLRLEEPTGIFDAARLGRVGSCPLPIAR